MNQRAGTERERKAGLRLPAVLLALVGGAIPGWLVGVLPHLPLGRASEVLQSRGYLLELMFLVLGRILPVPVMRWVRGPDTIPFLFTFLGAALGLGSFLFCRRERAPRRQFTAALAISASAVTLLLLLPFLKALFFYPAHAMLSLKGALFLSGAFLFSVLTGVLIYALFRTTRTAGSILIALLVVASVTFFFVPTRGEPPATAGFIPRRVVLIGVDAASWSVLDTLSRQGRLPHLGRFIDAAASGTLRATLPVRTPAIWTSVVTGQSSARHGVRDYVIRDPETGEFLPMSVSTRRVQALWDITSRAGRATDVVAWYGSWPAEKVRGRFLSDRLGFRSLEHRTEPPEAAGEFETLVPPMEDRQFPPTAMAGVARSLFRTGSPEVFLIYFNILDPVQHRFWAPFDVRRGSPLASLLFGRLPATVLDAESSRIAEAYADVDSAVGAVLEAAGDEATCILVSDHGQGPARGPMTFSLTEVLVRLGWLAFKADTRDIDWDLTKLSDGTRERRGRELPRELVPNTRPQSPLREAAPSGGDTALNGFMSEAARTLRDLRTAKGRALFTKVRLVPRRRDKSPRLDVWVATDLEADDAVLVGGARLAVTAVVDQNRLTGMHRIEGVFLAQGPGIRRRARCRDAGVMDITPTALYLLDLPVGRDMEGRVLKEVIDPRLLAARPVKWLPTYETGAEREPGPPVRSKADSRLLEELRSLGYIR